MSLKIVAPYPILYILARTDADSMNPGKMAAQACHAANQFVHQLPLAEGDQKFIHDLYKEWIKTTGMGFGTTIVLNAGSLKQIKAIVDSFVKYDVGQSVAGMVLDPEYPLRDGDVTHLFPMETCGYVFCDKSNEFRQYLLDKIPLYK